jgi:tetratricopeptide (TPR) repeat protein
LEALGAIAQHLGTHEEAKRLHQQSLALRRALGDRRGIAESLSSLGWVSLTQGQFLEGERFVRESVAICREMGDEMSVANGLSDLGSMLILSGQFADAYSLKEETLAIYNRLGLRSGTSFPQKSAGHFPQISLGHAQLHLGEYEKARVHFETGLSLLAESGAQWLIGYALCLLGWTAAAEEDYAEAQGLAQESVAVFRQIGQQSYICSALAALGVAKRGLGQRTRAGQHFHEALRMATELKSFVPLLWVLPALSLLLVDRDQAEWAVDTYALASRYPLVANSRWFEDVFGRHIAAVAATLSSDVVTAAQERGRARDLWATVEELLAELAR